MSNLDRGLDRMYDALMRADGDRIDRALTLGYVRMMFDADAPTIAGFDPRQLKQVVMPYVPGYGFMAADGNARGWLEAVTGRLNELMGEQLLVSDWESVDCRAAMQGLGKWKAQEHFCGGDILGQMLELLRPDMAKGGLGAYYTPWNVCYMMAKMTGVEPGKSIVDPACGSGRMLLAAIQVCREDHPGEPLPDCYGQDVDAAAVKACKLNLSLAGYHFQRVLQGTTDATVTDVVADAKPNPQSDGQPRVQLRLDLEEAA